MIFNSSFKTGVVPEQLKIAKVIPIYIYRKYMAAVLSNYSSLCASLFFNVSGKANVQQMHVLY